MLLLWSAGICATGEYLMKDVLPQQKVGGVVVQVSAEKKKGWALRGWYIRVYFFFCFVFPAHLAVIYIFLTKDFALYCILNSR